MQQMKPLNIPKIQEKIKIRHQKFIEALGPQTIKVAADNRLLTDLIATRTYHLLLCFREQGIIDDIQQSDLYPRKITISKKGFNNYVYILTNGHTIRIEGYNCDGNDFRSDVQLLGKNYYEVDNTRFDWDKFAMELLDYVHSSIYDSKDALEVKINGVLGGSPFSDEVQIINNTKKRPKK